MRDGVPVGERLRVWLGVPEVVLERVGVCVCVPVVEGVPVIVRLGVGVRLIVCDCVRVPEPVWLPVPVRV